MVQAAKGGDKMGRIRNITSMCESWDGNLTQQQIEERIAQSFPKSAYVYLEMDDSVALGVYRNGTYEMRLGASAVWREIPWEYVQRLMIFDESQELRLFRRDRHFNGRLRRDCPCDAAVCAADEVQKLRGEVREHGPKAAGWSRLSSRRGNSIWIPMALSAGSQCAGLQIRKYFEFPDATEGRGLIVQIDERIVGLGPWPQCEGSV